MNLYWLVELDSNTATALRTLAVVGEAGKQRSYRLLAADGPKTSPETDPDEERVMLVDVDVAVPFDGHRLGLLPVAVPPLVDDLDEAIDHLVERIAATMVGPAS